VKFIDEQDTSAPIDTPFPVQNNVKYSVDVKLALDIMQAQFSMFQGNSIDSSTNACIMDWIILALSPMGKSR
jgi:hypothetical protein